VRDERAATLQAARYDAGNSRLCPQSRGNVYAKAIIVVLLIAVVTSLLVSVIFLIRDPSSRRRALLSLKIRVALSITLLLFIVFSYFMGWIQPHGLMP
jgi:hypothetical protein